MVLGCLSTWRCLQCYLTCNYVKVVSVYLVVLVYIIYHSVTATNRKEGLPSPFVSSFLHPFPASSSGNFTKRLNKQKQSSLIFIIIHFCHKYAHVQCLQLHVLVKNNDVNPLSPNGDQHQISPCNIKWCFINQSGHEN